MEYELQVKIKAAAQKLAQDKSTSKYVRKQRRQSYNKAAAKVSKLNEIIDRILDVSINYFGFLWDRTQPDQVQGIVS